MVIIMDMASGRRIVEMEMPKHTDLEPAAYQDDVLMAEWTAVPRLESADESRKSTSESTDHPVSFADADFLDRVYRWQR